MASGGERSATTTAVEKGSDKVIVTCLVEGLQVSLLGKEPKNASVFVKFHDWGFDMTAEVTENNRTTTFRKEVKKLPRQVDVNRCKWKVKKGKVMITLVKTKEESWAVQLSQRGLEQYQNDEEDKDD